MVEPTHIVHGVPFVRTGLCNRCPGISAPCCIDCSHLEYKSGVNTCLIYKQRKQVCKSCSDIKGKDVTHEVCIDFPDHPWLDVIKKGQCAYTFIENKIDGISKKDILDAEWGK